MMIELNKEIEEMVMGYVRDGIFTSPQDVIDAAIQSYKRNTLQHFAPGTLDALLEPAKKEFERGEFYTANEVRAHFLKKNQERADKP